MRIVFGSHFGLQKS